MFSPVYVVYSESGIAYGMHTDKEQAKERARAYAVGDGKPYTVQEYAPTLFSVTMIPIPEVEEVIYR